MVSKAKAAAVERNGAYPVTPGTPQVQQGGGLVTVDCTLTGISPLLMNAMGADELLKIYTKEKGSKTAARPTPREAAESGLHLNADGWPTADPYLLPALTAAGQYVRLDGKRQVSTAKKTVLSLMFWVVSSDHRLYVPGTDEPATWDVDIMQGKNPNGGEAVAVIRPRFDRWEVRCQFDVDQSTMPLPLAYELVMKAGRVAGFGDFRPGCRGTYGRFAITNWTPRA